MCDRRIGNKINNDGHGSYKDPLGDLFVKWAYLNNVSHYSQVQNHVTSTRASKMGVSPGLQESEENILR